MEEKQKRELENFISYMTHEIKQPLSGIKSMLVSALSEEEIPREKVDLCVEGIERINGFLAETLELIKMRQYCPKVKISALPKEKLISYITAVMSPLTEEKDITLSVKCKDFPYQYLYTDGNLIYQILWNLITNAVKYTPSGGMVEVSFNGEEIEEYRVRLKITVRDTGIGMTPEFLERAWASFEQEGRIKEGGVGLGLAITKKIVDILRGEIHIKSAQGAGTEVVVCLELDGSDEIYKDKSAAKGREEIKELNEPLLTSGKKILIAENDELYMNLLVEILQKNGIIADKTYDGDEVADLFEESGEYEYDMILMDLEMPECNGFEAANKIRNMKRQDAESIPIFAFTGYLFTEVAEFLSRYNMQGIIPKIFEEEKLIRILEEYFRNNSGNGR